MLKYVRMHSDLMIEVDRVSDQVLVYRPILKNAWEFIFRTRHTLH
jgi:hypothetical protein